ncbi:YhfC family glutamic-type intramembrane protease [Paenibacillus kobensis]|uniref:YhfC family glutamic-type intramembrane protease n=1 Tax=Paenibacillus kobensis TaxID=59841 RepID=UPI0013E343FC|nr:YhfC family glutamic-type intramembrane protease [Paenibacillus kobensis]
MNMAMKRNEELDLKIANASRKAMLSFPLYIAVPVLFAVAFWLTGYEVEWKAYGLGALGWIAALFLRGPVSVIVMKMPQERAKNIMIASSGVMEETIRLVLLAVTSFGSSWALSVGQGWAAVEVLYVLVTIIAIKSLANRTDEKALQAKQMLEANGNIQTSPLWGVLERVWASALHIGATLVVAYNPWTVIALIPLHSAVNFIAVLLAAKSIGRSSAFIAAVGGIVLLLGVYFQFILDK